MPTEDLQQIPENLGKSVISLPMFAGYCKIHLVRMFHFTFIAKHRK
jgi:hypothetical protein